MSLPAKRWLIATTLAAILIVVIAPAPQPGAARGAQPGDGWLVPRLPVPPANPQAAVTGLLKSSLWGGQADAASLVDDKASRWRLAGITGSPADRYAIVQFGDDRIQQLKAGDKFPDGTFIAQVREAGVCVVIEGKKRFLPLDSQAVPIIW